MTKPQLAASLIALSLATGFVVAPAAPALAAANGSQAQPSDPAAQQIRGFYDTLLDSMKNAKALGVKGRFKKLAPAVDSAFDFPDMTQMTIGPQWDSLSAADKKMLIDAFRRMTIADYAHNFDGYGGESFTVDPNVRERKGDKVVFSKMEIPGKAAIPFIYRMRKTDKGWQIVDIYLNGSVSEVATRRADFASTLKSGGAKALADKLNKISDQTLAGS